MFGATLLMERVSVPVFGGCRVYRNGRVHGCNVTTDRLTPDRVDAVRRIETPGSFGQSGQLRPSPLEPVDVLVECAQMPFEKGGDVFAGALSTTPQVEDRIDLGEREPGSLGIADERQAVNGVFPIVAITIGGSSRLRHEADVLVVANRFRRSTGPPSHFTDLHPFSLPPQTF